MWTDPIVEEIRKYRNEHAAQHGYDIDAIFRDIKRREKESGKTYITLQQTSDDESNLETIEAHGV
ncbi:MAG: hypothetical protein EPO24_14395 [Bacteroidetes bacterium]|nr:MAG: hypothetical protein EPO24_14395 [Bacteroidota bacterium]